jgi:hypothetical protein
VCAVISFKFSQERSEGIQSCKKTFGKLPARGAHLMIVLIHDTYSDKTVVIFGFQGVVSDLDLGKMGMTLEENFKRVIHTDKLTTSSQIEYHCTYIHVIKSLVYYMVDVETSALLLFYYIFQLSRSCHQSIKLILWIGANMHHRAWPGILEPWKPKNR